MHWELIHGTNVLGTFKRLEDLLQSIDCDELDQIEIDHQNRVTYVTFFKIDD